MRRSNPPLQFAKHNRYQNMKKKEHLVIIEFDRINLTLEEISKTLDQLIKNEFLERIAKNSEGSYINLKEEILNNMVLKVGTRIYEHANKQWIKEHLNGRSSFKLNEVLPADLLPRMVLIELTLNSLTNAFKLAGLKQPKEVYERDGRIKKISAPRKSFEVAMNYMEPVYAEFFKSFFPEIKPAASNYEA